MRRAASVPKVSIPSTEPGGLAGQVRDPSSTRRGQHAERNLSGPFKLTFEGIDCAVTRTSAGVYLLGNTATNGRFLTQHVGRSDWDVKTRLRDHIGSATQFKYAYLDSAWAAFARQCELFHVLQPSGNRVHPDRAKGTRWECPGCRIYGH
jgi:hypothetical protein